MPTREFEGKPPLQFGDDPRRLTLFIDPGDAPTELLTELFIALTVAYRAAGGSGLAVVSGETREVPLSAGIVV